MGNHGVDIGSEPNINAGAIVGLGTLGQPEYPRTAATTLFFQGFSSSYNALQVKLDRHFSNGFLMTTAFTWLGFGLLGLTFGSLEFILDKGQQDDWFASQVITFFVVAMVVAFITMALISVVLERALYARLYGAS